MVASAGLSACLGCGGSSGPAAENSGARLGTPIRLVDCRDWLKAGPSDRAGIIAGIKAFSGGPVGSPAGRGKVLSDHQAYNLFEADCRRSFAKRFTLYKLYTRAAAFQVH